MISKIPSIKAATQEESVRVYHELYQDPAVHIRMKMKWRGSNSLLYSLLRKDLPGKRVVDLGCGHGRVVMLCARDAKHVTGVELEETAVNVARLVKDSLGAMNVEFVQQDLGSYRPKIANFDYVILAGVLRHLVDPDIAFKTASAVLAPGGTFALATTLEANTRGTISDSFRTLLNWPMSLNDFHTATDQWIREKADAFGFRIVKAVGCAYNYAWAELGAQDLKQRISNVLIDIRGQTTHLNINKPAFDAWVDVRAKEGDTFVQELVRRRILKRIPKRAAFPLNPSDLMRRGLSADAVSALQDYMQEDFSADPYYSDVYPFNIMGGQAIYLMQKEPR
jgi:2-polyprenyl-3-methyl-5-hydroxy-6-metoxy-1,4-benzoquinol methylase